MRASAATHPRSPAQSGVAAFARKRRPFLARAPSSRGAGALARARQRLVLRACRAGGGARPTGPWMRGATAERASVGPGNSHEPPERLRMTAQERGRRREAPAQPTGGAAPCSRPRPLQEGHQGAILNILQTVRSCSDLAEVDTILRLVERRGGPWPTQVLLLPLRPSHLGRRKALQRCSSCSGRLTPPQPTASSGGACRLFGGGRTAAFRSGREAWSTPTTSCRWP